MDIPFVGPSLRGISPAFNDQRTQNMYLEVDPGAKRPIALVGSPGKQSDNTLNEAPIRGSILFKGSTYWVAGSEVYRRDIGGVTSLIGTIDTTSGPVSMDQNLTSFIIVDGTTKGYTSDGATITPITDPDFPGGDTVTFLDQRLYVNSLVKTIQVAASDLNDATAWNALAVKTAEAKADRVLAVLADEEWLYVLCEFTTEVWWNPGTLPFPLARAAGGVHTWGIIAPFSAAIADNGIIWLARQKEGEGPFVVRTAGTAIPDIISTSTLSALWSEYTTRSDARAHVYAQAGHLFYQLTFPSANETWVYDLSNQTWHERARFGLGRDPGIAHVFHDGKNLIGDDTTGKIYHLRLDYFKDDGVTTNTLGTIERIRTTPILNADERVIFYHALKILAETGVGNADVTDPTMMLDWSDDLRVFKNQRFLSLGKSGEFDKEIRPTRLGAAVNRIFRMIITDPCKIRIIGADATVTLSDRQTKRSRA